MARVVDAQLVASRDQAISQIRRASEALTLSTHKHRGLASATHTVVGEHPSGSPLKASLALAQRALEDAAAQLARAEQAARGVDVTVEVPDEAEASRG